ncbi:UDP-galactose transporter 6 [Artemisia annua]|uniref:UDP-galactose transporter 6 n=1 Tax=Artemisia annua TaxID=35608 RepID=A0A2U1MMI0_ARTAN|nr:UDP-galactose transporter 6 [Artemisia annua]
MKQGMIECSVCHSKLVNPSAKTVSRAYDRHRSKYSKKQRALNVLLVVGDCMLVGLQPILVYMSKVDGKFKFSPISVNFLTEVAKVIFALVMLLIQARNQKIGEKPLLSVSSFVQAARNNVLLAVPAFLYAINNYLKFTMQVEDVTTNKEVQAVGKYSVEEYNRLKGNKDNDGQLMFVKVVEVEKQVVSGMKYYLTIEAVNKTSGEVKVFEAVVVVKAWLRKKELVKFSPSQKMMTILQPVW